MIRAFDGGRLEIVYLPDSPRKVRLRDREPQIVPVWAGPLVLVRGLAGFMTLRRGRRRDACLLHRLGTRALSCVGPIPGSPPCPAPSPTCSNSNA